jgi:ribosomal protein L11 methyltransferase
MSWWAIDVRTTPSRREWLSAWLVARTGQAVEEREDGTLVTFAPDEGAADALIAELGEAAGEPAAAERRPLETVDWTTQWRDGLGARRFGRLVVVPSWVAEPSDFSAMVVLDPETAFGSGSGILAIAAVKLGAARAVGIETDPEANVVAVRNAFRNEVRDQVEFLDGDAGDLAPLLGPADLLLSNILRSVNAQLLPAIVRSLRPGGVAIFAGMEQAEAPLFRPLLAPAGLSVVDEQRDTGWWSVAARRE